jgi:hypothetical protein
MDGIHTVLPSFPAARHARLVVSFARSAEVHQWAFAHFVNPRKTRGVARFAG